MFIRSLIVCSLLMGAVFTGNIDKARKDFAASVPSKEIVISSEEVEISTENKDQILEDIDIIRRQYLDLRNKYNAWMEDPYHKNVIAPAAIGAVSALVTMIFLCILFCWCKRCISTRLGYRNLNESQTGWFGRRNASHDS